MEGKEQTGKVLRKRYSATLHALKGGEQWGQRHEKRRFTPMYRTCEQISDRSVHGKGYRKSGAPVEFTLRLQGPTTAVFRDAHHLEDPNPSYHSILVV